MSRLGDKLEKCFSNGHIDFKQLLEVSSVYFGNCGLDDVSFIESECRDLRRKFEDAEKVECYKTNGIAIVGWGDIAYFSLDEIDQVKQLANQQIEKGNFNFKIEKIKISRPVLEGHIRDRKEWEAV